MLDSSAIQKTISFDTYAQHILGIDFNRVKLVGLLDTDSARHYGDVAGLAQAIYPTLPEGTPIEYRAYTWAKIQLGKDQYTVIALPWIKNSTIEIHSGVSLEISVGGISANDVPHILNLLRSNGYVNISSKII